MTVQPLDMVAIGEEMTPTRYRDKPAFAALVRSRSLQAQKIADALAQLRLINSIEDMEGVQLDVIGRRVGQPRDGRSDDVYRIWLRVRVRVNRATGRPRDVLEVMRLAVGDGPTIRYVPEYPAGFTLRIYSTSESVDALRALLTDVTMGGVRSVLEHSTAAPSELFTFDSGPGFDAGLFAGAID